MSAHCVVVQPLLGMRRVCIVNNDGAVLMDKFVRPKERITDFRTRYRCIVVPLLTLRPAAQRGSCNCVVVALSIACRHVLTMVGLSRNHTCPCALSSMTLCRRQIATKPV